MYKTIATRLISGISFIIMAHFMFIGVTGFIDSETWLELFKSSVLVGGSSFVMYLVLGDFKYKRWPWEL